MHDIHSMRVFPVVLTRLNLLGCCSSTERLVFPEREGEGR